MTEKDVLRGVCPSDTDCFRVEPCPDVAQDWVVLDPLPGPGGGCVGSHLGACVWKVLSEGRRLVALPLGIGVDLLFLRSSCSLGLESGGSASLLQV